MALTQDQIKANIDAMEAQGAPKNVIQSYLDGLPKTPPKQSTLGGQIVRGLIKPFARAATNLVNVGQIATGNKQTTPFSGGYLGDVRPVGENFDSSQFLTKNNIAAVTDAAKVGTDIGLTFAGGGGAKKAAQIGFKGALKQAAKQGLKEGTLIGGISGASTGLEEGATVGSTLKNTALGIGVGGLLGVGTAGLGAVAGKAKTGLVNTPEKLNAKLDSHIKDIFKGTTSDVQKVNDSAFKAKKGLELLQKESGSIKIPDSTAPLGSKVSKPFNLQKSTPNELLSGVLEMDKKIATNGRTAATKASQRGLKIDTTEVKNSLMSNLDIPKATRGRLLEQLDRTQGDPLKIHDWVQDVNVKYGRRFQNGTIDDNLLSKTVNDVAENLRGKLNTIVDRKGYAEAYGNNQELKRMLVSIAKKANKGVNFGDISTDAGLDLGISILTGNPAYMARTVGTGIFRGVMSSVKNKAGIKSFKKAAELSRQLPTKTRLPSTRIKNQLESTTPPPIAQTIKSSPTSTVGNIQKATKSIANTDQKLKAGDISRTLPQPKKKTSEAGFAKPSTLAGGAATTVGIGAAYKKLQDKYGTVNYQAKEEVKQKHPQKLGEALMQLESSGGKNKKNQDDKEMKWLVGLTPIAIAELKRARIKNSVDINDREDVIDAGIKYFQYLQKKNPTLSPAEVYVDKYWIQAETPEQRRKKIDEFNRLTNQ